MDTLDCGHVAYTASRRVCRHLLVEEPPTFVGLLTGVGVDYDLTCDVCADNPARELLLVCEGCVARAADWDSMTGWRGTPEIRIHDRQVIGRWSEFGCSFIPQNDWCVAPLPLGWAIVTGHLLILLDQAGEVAAEYPLSVAPEPPSEWRGHVRGPALHTSPDGLFAAVVTDYGQFGQVIDLETGARPLVLDRGSYHDETTPFPVCFVTVDGDPVVVAATAWNRLDVFRAATGRLLTSRETEWVKGQPRPEHHLDYFHGRLLPSPGGRWILDDGWVWHPLGVPTVIDVAAWLSGHVHAAENGTALSYRAYAWDQPVAWLDEDIIAIQRIGYDDEQMLAGVQLFDVPTGRVSDAFAGPSGRMWAYGGGLYVVGTAGTEIWDPEVGARIGILEGFAPTAHDARTGTMAEFGNGVCRTWTPG